MGKINYVNGITPSVAKRIAKFTFGNRFLNLRVDEDNIEFIFLLKPSKPEEEENDLQIEAWFSKYWGKQWKIYKVDK